MTDKELIKQKMLVTEANECRSEKNRVKMAHIAFSDSDMGMLKLNLYHLFRSQGLKKDYVVIPFILSLSCGNISAPYLQTHC